MTTPSLTKSRPTGKNKSRSVESESCVESESESVFQGVNVENVSGSRIEMKTFFLNDFEETMIFALSLKIHKQFSVQRNRHGVWRQV